MLNATLYNLRVALIRLIFTCCSVYHVAFSFGSAEANGLFEVSTGVTVPTGSDLESSYNLGGQASLGWGGRPPFMGEGGSIYMVGALRRERLSQEGQPYFGSPRIERTQWTPSVGARLYNLIAEEWRASAELGLGYTYDQSSMSTPSTQLFINDLNFNGESTVLTLGLGLQRKLTAGLLLSMSLEQLFYLNKKAISYPERPLLTAQDSSITGRSRFSIGIGFYL